jgi:hypothetical protein
LKKKWLFLCASFLSFSCLSQNGGEEGNVKAIHSPFLFSIRGNALIPHPVANEAFRKSFNGVYDATISFNLELYKGINLGLVYKNSIFQTPANKIPQLNTKIQYNAGGIRIGYDYFINKIAQLSVALNGGECYMKAYDLVVNKYSSKIQTMDQGHYIEPEVAVSFYTEENFAIGFNLSYELIATQFDPYKLALEQHIVGAYTPGDLVGYTQNFSLGFHFVYAFGRKGKGKR